MVRLARRTAIRRVLGTLGALAAVWVAAGAPIYQPF